MKDPEQDEGTAFRPRFGADGLLTAVVVDASTAEVLMVAHMNADALERTRTTGEAYFWSRSRRTLWHKGATSGNRLRVREMLTDCDQDAVVLRVDAEGPACHTGRPSCFYRVVPMISAGKQSLTAPVELTFTQRP